MTDINANVEGEAKFFAKIEKLLALAKHDRTNENEATSAAAMVQRLLQERGLTLAHVEARGGQSADPNQAARDKTTTDRRALYLWQQRLMAAIARNNFCLHRLEEVWAMDRGKNRKSKRHMLIGRPINIRVTLLAYDYLVATIRRLAGEDGFGHAEREKDHHIFLDAAVIRLKERLDEQREAREEEDERRKKEAAATRRHPSAAPAEPGTALVLTDVYGSEEELNQDRLHGLEPGTTSAARREREARQEEARQREIRREAHQEQLEKDGVPYPKSYYMACGYSEDRAQALHDEYEKDQADAAKREAKRSKARTHNYSSNYRESAKDRSEWERQQSPAYKAGSKAGDRVNLDQQIENARRKIK